MMVWNMIFLSIGWFLGYMLIFRGANVWSSMFRRSGTRLLLLVSERELNNSENCEVLPDRIWRNELNVSFVWLIYKPIKILQWGMLTKYQHCGDFFTFLFPQTPPKKLNVTWVLVFKEDDFQPIYHCAHCNQRRFASKRTWLWSLPPVLPVQLKRFHCETSTGTFQNLGESRWPGGWWNGVARWGPGVVLGLVNQDISQSER